MTIFICDVDGTLTLPRLPIDTQFLDFLIKWKESHTLLLISGSQYDKINEQLLGQANKFSLFTASGNEFHYKGNLEWSNPEVEWDKSLINYLEQEIANSTYKKFGNHLEYRKSALNLSFVGRSCPFAERKKYFKYDKKHNQRIKLVEYINTNYKKYQATIGGEISIDITPKGFGKEQIVKELSKLGIRCDDSETIVFFGDKIIEGGNDYELGKLANLAISVNSWEETKNIMEKIVVF